MPVSPIDPQLQFVPTAVAPAILREPLAWPSNRVAEVDGFGRTLLVQPDAYPLTVAAGGVATTQIELEGGYWFRVLYGLGAASPTEGALINRFAGSLWPLYVSLYSSDDWRWVERWTPFAAIFGNAPDRRDYPIPGGGLVLPPSDALQLEVRNTADDDVVVYMAFVAQRLDDEAAY